MLYLLYWAVPWPSKGSIDRRNVKNRMRALLFCFLKTSLILFVVDGWKHFIRLGACSDDREGGVQVEEAGCG